MSVSGFDFIFSMLSREIPVSVIDHPLRADGKWLRVNGEITFVKAVSFGPFPVGAFPDEGVGELLRIRDELGANALRLYEIPSLDFLHACAATGLRVFIGLPWSQHIDFLKQAELVREAETLLVETVTRFRGHPAVAGYFVGNEIDSLLVRWMGAAQVVEVIEQLIDLGHDCDPEALFAYANYPSTEYLLPQNQDFVAFNLFLETPEALASYLDRLQNLAGGKPLLLSEFGVDSLSHGEEKQSEMLAWAIKTALTAAAAGVTIFSWSDQWLRGGRTIEDWCFGLTRRDHSAKPALTAIHTGWSQPDGAMNGPALSESPMVSVIVCTYRGSATLVACLESVAKLDYLEFETLVVNDGDDRRVAEIVESYESVRHISTPHIGLGAARNLGASEARGEIFIYLDDDCIVEADWLKWIVWQFATDASLGCAGGPNLAPHPQSATQAQIAAAPGGPCHVLLDDRHAEHLPGCNLAVRRDVFEKVGGFDPIFRTAGDDVDFCWRVLATGKRLGFHSAAFVWHYRRFTWQAYFRQQIGYGRAEAMLMPLHPNRFRGLDGALWQGHVYVSRRRFGATVYHGHYGHEPFQLMYPGGDSWFGEVALHIIWWVILLILSLGGIFAHFLWLPAGVMLFGTLYVAVGRAGRSFVTPEYDTTSTRLVLVILILVQGFLRSGTRVLRGWRYATWGRGLRSVGTNAAGALRKGWWKLGDDLAYWSEDGVGRKELLAAILRAFPNAQDDISGKTDILFRRGWLWNWAVVTVTEYHSDRKRLTRLRLLAKPQKIMKAAMLGLIFLGPLAGLASGRPLGDLLGYAFGIAVGAWAISRMMMWTHHPRFHRIAKSVGLRKVNE